MSLSSGRLEHGGMAHVLRRGILHAELRLDLADFALRARAVLVEVLVVDLRCRLGGAAKRPLKLTADS